MFIGLAGTAAASGFAVAIYEWHVSLYYDSIFKDLYIYSYSYSVIYQSESQIRSKNKNLVIQIGEIGS